VAGRQQAPPAAPSRRQRRGPSEPGSQPHLRQLECPHFPGAGSRTPGRGGLRITRPGVEPATVAENDRLWSHHAALPWSPGAKPTTAWATLRDFVACSRGVSRLMVVSAESRGIHGAWPAASAALATSPLVCRPVSTWPASGSPVSALRAPTRWCARCWLTRTPDHDGHRFTGRRLIGVTGGTQIPDLEVERA
jgi:hypothetical protein